MKMLPNRIDKYSDESLEGFLYRLAFINHRELKDLNIKYIRDYAKEKDIQYNLGKIHDLTGQSITEDQIYPYNWYLQGLTLPEWKTKLYTRCCPECLNLKQYHRAFWCLTHHTYCFEHKIYLLDQCPCCHAKINIKDVTLGKCGNCSFEYRKSNAQSTPQIEEYLSGSGEFMGVDSPFLSHSLSNMEQLILTQWLSYYLVDKTNFYNLDMSNTEKKRLAYNGYFRDIKIQFQLMTHARQLLSAWPTKLILFLQDQFANNHNKIQGFFSRFIYMITDQRLNNLLWHSYLDEVGYGGYHKFTSENIEYDNNYLQIATLKMLYNIPQEVLHKCLRKLNITLVTHPRNHRKLIHKNQISLILNEFRNAKHSFNYYSLEEVARVLDKDKLSITIICEFIGIPSRTYIGEKCYHFNTLLQQKDAFDKYATIDEFLPSSIWDSKTLINYLDRVGVKIFFKSRHRVRKYLYKKEEVICALQALSNDLEDYLPRPTVMEKLGYALLNAGQLEGFYLQGHEGTPYYLKACVEEILFLFDKMSINEVRKHRRLGISGWL
ncbi:TniQ family protein [Paenibacillus solanacearum]|nr:TniQ family protein [Paenibacillus solanacearum]